MLKFEETALERFVIHNIGNKIQEQDLVLSKYELSLNDETMEELLMTYFLSSFKTERLYHFSHEKDVELNEVYGQVKKIFEHPTHNFLEQSKEIAKQLYEKSTHPNIKSGEMYVCYFSDCIVGDDVCDAIGIFKSENKETYLKVHPKQETFDVEYDTGVNIKKLDKGCIVFDLEDDHGYKVAIVDKTNKQEEAVYWKENFLGLRPREDRYFHTYNTLNICKDFVQDVFNSEHNVDRSEQIEMLNKSVQYFEGNEAFERKSFDEGVLVHPEIIDAFKDYKQTYAEDRNLMIFDEFDISPDAVKLQKKNFKGVIKLDNNFEIKILSCDRERIEKGYDAEQDLNFYKVYFKREV